MSERRRLKAGVEVRWRPNMDMVDAEGRVLVRAVTPEEFDLITEPIPEEPAEPPLDVRMDCAEEFASDLERTLTVLEVRLNAMEDRIEALEQDNKRRMDAIVEGMTRRTIANHMRTLDVRAMIDPLAKRIEALERGERRHAVRIVPGSMEEIVLDVDDVRMASVHPNPKEVMPDDAVQDAPGADEPSVDEVLEWLEDIESAFAASVTDAKMPITAARIIRELGEEIEEWSSLYRRTHGKMAELRAEVASLTERLTITDEKVEAAYHAWSHGPSSIEAFRAALRAAGMIDPEVEG